MTEEGRFDAGLRALAVPAGFALAVVVLLAAGHGDLAPPRRDLTGWLEEVGPLAATMATIRLAALGSAAWLLVATTVEAVASMVGATRVEALARRAMPATVRRVLTAVAGIGAAGTALVGVGGQSAAGDPGPPATATMVRDTDETVPAPAPAGSVEPSAVGVEDDDGTAVMAQLGPAEWIVEPGDCFWSVAEDVIGDHLGRSPTDAEVAAYWLVLIDANRDRLATGDPDLLYPGQRLTLPAP